MTQIASALSTGDPSTAILNPTQIGRLPGAHMHYPTFAAYTVAVAAEQGNIAGATTGGASVPTWADQQPLTVSSEPSDVYRVWNASAGHARKVVIRPGLSVTLATDLNTVLSGAGAPASGVGNNGDISVDYAGNQLFTKGSGVWAQTLATINSAGPAGPGAAWGSMTGNIANQADLQTAISNGSPDPYVGMTSAQIVASSANLISYYNGYNSGTAGAAIVTAKNVVFTYTPKPGTTALTSTIGFDSTGKIVQISAWS